MEVGTIIGLRYREHEARTIWQFPQPRDQNIWYANLVLHGTSGAQGTEAWTFESSVHEEMPSHSYFPTGSSSCLTD